MHANKPYYSPTSTTYHKRTTNGILIVSCLIDANANATMTMKYRNTITTVALLSIGTLVFGIDVPAGELRAKPTSLEIAAFWTPERIRSVVPRDVAIDIGTGVTLVRQSDGTMAPMNVNSASLDDDDDPTSTPSDKPTKNPTSLTLSPSEKLTASPVTANADDDPTGSPSVQPTKNPTSPPTSSPSKKPTVSPETPNPTSSPMLSPTPSPSLNPTSSPSGQPTKNPSSSPTLRPTRSPTLSPSTNGASSGNEIIDNTGRLHGNALSALSWSETTHDYENLNAGDRQLQEIVGNEDVESPTPPELQAVGRLLFCFGDPCFICSAHCTFDGFDFAENVMFIPNQDDGGGDGTDFDCSNDLYGCWFPDHAIITSEYLAGGALTLDDDFAVMVVKTGNGDSHLSVDGFDDAPLDEFVCPFSVDFNREAFVSSSDFGTAYGYPGSNDPGFRFCQGGVEEFDLGPVIGVDVTTVWMPDCLMTGGSSGGPWVPYPTTDIYSAVSYGLVSGGERLPGQGGTRCYVDGRCQCVLDAAQTSTGNLIVNDVSCPLTRLEASGPVCASETAPPTRNPTRSPSKEPTNSPTKNLTSSPTKTSGSRSSGRTSKSSKSAKSSKSKKNCSNTKKEKKCKNECEWLDDECVEKSTNCDEFVTKKKCNKYYANCEWDLESNLCTNTEANELSANATVTVTPLSEKVAGLYDGLVTRIQPDSSGCTIAKAPVLLGGYFAFFVMMCYQ